MFSVSLDIKILEIMLKSLLKKIKGAIIETFSKKTLRKQQKRKKLIKSSRTIVNNWMMCF